MKKTSIHRQFGKKIRQVRAELGLSQETLAFKAGISPGYLGHIERGTRKSSLDTVEKLADALGVSVQSLVALPDQPTVYLKTEEDLLARQIALLIKDKSPKYRKMLLNFAKCLTEKK